MCKGFIRVPRRLFETPWWSKRRVWSETDAVIDLYQQANARDRTEPDGTKVLRNQFVTSNRTLADKWYWPPMKVNRFLKKLEEDGWIKVEARKTKTFITIIDFGADTMQSDTLSDTQGDTPNDTPSDTPKPLYTKALREVSDTPTDTPSGTQGGTQSDTYINNIRIEENKDNLLFDIAEQYPFEEFWSLYDKKVGKSKSLSLYNKLSLKDRKAVFEYIPKYKLAQPDKQYRKDPETFLRNRSWEDELISRYGTSTALHDNSTEKFDNEEDWKL